MIAVFARDPVDTFIRTYPWVIPAFIVFIWFVVGYLVARISGWATLADYYRAVEEFQGETWRFQRVQMRYLSHYNNCVTFGTNVAGLYSAMFFLLRLGHPPLFIRWDELEIQPKRRFLMMGYELRFRQAPGVLMWVMSRTGARIFSASPKSGSVRMAPQIG